MLNYRAQLIASCCQEQRCTLPKLIRFRHFYSYLEQWRHCVAIHCNVIYHQVSCRVSSAALRNCALAVHLWGTVDSAVLKNPVEGSMQLTMLSHSVLTAIIAIPWIIFRISGVTGNFTRGHAFALRMPFKTSYRFSLSVLIDGSDHPLVTWRVCTPPDRRMANWLCQFCHKQYQYLFYCQ